MEATILDLRYHMKKVLAALNRNEQVKILYHGKVKGIILPAKKSRSLKVKDHPLFGIDKKSKVNVKRQMEILRGGRYSDL